jgi:hypothetical protein
MEVNRYTIQTQPGDRLTNACPYQVPKDKQGLGGQEGMRVKRTGFQGKSIAQKRAQMKENNLII